MEVPRRLRDRRRLKAELDDTECWDIVWRRAVDLADRGTGIKDFPVALPWSRARILGPGDLPD